MSWRRLVSTRKGCFMMKAPTTGTTPLNMGAIRNNDCTVMLIPNIYFRFKLLETKLESTLKSTLEIKEEKIAALEARLQESSNLNQQLRQELKTVRSMYACATNLRKVHSLRLLATLKTQKVLRSMHYLFMYTFASDASLSIHVAAMEDVCFSSERYFFSPASLHINYVSVEPRLFESGFLNLHSSKWILLND